ncbi:hypothetical protein D9M68_501680 [compost metagenome]
MRNAARRAGAPEAEHPRGDLHRVGRRDAQGPKRVEQPLRRLFEDAGRGERQDVGKGEGPGIAGRGTCGRAFPVEHGDGKSPCLGGDRRGKADNAGADDDDVRLSCILHDRLSASLPGTSGVPGPSARRRAPRVLRFPPSRPCGRRRRGRKLRGQTSFRV